VFSEICAGIDRRNTVQQHIHQHIRDFIAIDVEVSDGRLVDLADRWGFLCRDSGLSQELYVDPNSGLIRLNRHYRSWRQRAVEYRKREAAGIAARRRVVDECTLLLLLEGIWFRVEVGELPKEPRYDVVLRKTVSRAVQADLQQCKYLYGSSDLYAVSKRQISTREIKAHQLR
jgi:hypothetical protein